MKIAMMALLLALAGSASAEEPLALTGKWGIGFDSIPGASAGTGFVPGFSQPNAASMRCWVNEKFSWEGDLALSAQSQPGAPPTGGTTSTTGWGAGTLLKYNFARPSSLVLAQFIGGASFAQLATKNEGGSTAAPAAGQGQTTSTFSLYVGTGFEAFLPFWPALSVEGSVGFRVSTTQTKTEGQAQATASNSSLGVSGTGFSPLNVAIHYYF